MAVRLETHRGTAAALHALPFPDDSGARIWHMRPAGPALVMGSGQSADLFDRAGLARAGVELAPRRSGGGAVWIDPASTVWIDVFAPRGSPLYAEDLTTTFVLVGRVWQRAFAASGVHLDLARQAPKDPLARWVCWAGVGWGELFLPGHLGGTSRGGPVAKVLGLSQRRTRWGARVQGMAVVDGSAVRAADWFADPGAPRAATLRSRIGAKVDLVDVGLDRMQLSEAVIEQLRVAAG